MTIRGVRGAITVEADLPEAIAEATCMLLEEMQAANPSMRTTDLASAFFTLTPDLSAVFPAEAARALSGWVDVPLLCSQEVAVPGSMPRTLRVLLHWNTELPQREIRHVYLGAAEKLRPDLRVRDTAPAANGRPRQRGDTS